MSADTHLGCWANAIPCSGSIDVPFLILFSLAINRGALSALRGHPSSLPHPQQWRNFLTSSASHIANLFHQEEAVSFKCSPARGLSFLVWGLHDCQALVLSLCLFASKERTVALSYSGKHAPGFTPSCTSLTKLEFMSRPWVDIFQCCGAKYD